MPASANAKVLTAKNVFMMDLPSLLDVSLYALCMRRHARLDDRAKV
jgi:hypothetical protein